MIRLTQNDKNILKFIENYGGITIRQCALGFYNKKSQKSNWSYDYARKRLSKLKSSGLLDCYKDKTTSEYIYHFKDNKKIITPHTKYLLDFYVNLLHYGINILYFKPNFEYKCRKMHSDGFFKIQYNGDIYIIAVEIDFTHFTNIEKYRFLYDSNELQEQYGTFPLIFIMGDKERKFDFDHTVNEYIIFIDYDMSNFKDIVLGQLL